MYTFLTETKTPSLLAKTKITQRRCVIFEILAPLYTLTYLLTYYFRALKHAGISDVTDGKC